MCLEHLLPCFPPKKKIVFVFSTEGSFLRKKNNHLFQELTLRDFFFSGGFMALTGGLLTVTLGVLALEGLDGGKMQ